MPKIADMIRHIEEQFSLMNVSLGGALSGTGGGGGGRGERAIQSTSMVVGGLKDAGV